LAADLTAGELWPPASLSLSLWLTRGVTGPHVCLSSRACTLHRVHLAVSVELF
jgi:hypothetical protein